MEMDRRTEAAAENDRVIQLHIHHVEQLQHIKQFIWVTCAEYEFTCNLLHQTLNILVFLFNWLNNYFFAVTAIKWE